jgi:predicted nucleic acid-binding protein
MKLKFAAHRKMIVSGTVLTKTMMKVVNKTPLAQRMNCTLAKKLYLAYKEDRNASDRPTDRQTDRSWRKVVVIAAFSPPSGSSAARIAQAHVLLSSCVEGHSIYLQVGQSAERCAFAKFLYAHRG